MSDFTAEDLFEAIDRTVADLFTRHGIDRPPVDAILLAQEAFELTIRDAEEEDEQEQPGRFGPRVPRRRGREIVLCLEQTDETRQAICARACAKEMMPAILTRLGIAPGTENRSAQPQLVGTIAPRLLLPTRWFEREARKTGYDLAGIKERFATAGFELIALRFLDLEEACVVAVVHDGVVSLRRGNRSPASKVLNAAERLCLEMVGQEGEVQTARRDGWTSRGWPIPTGPFHRIILRSVPDEV